MDYSNNERDLLGKCAYDIFSANFPNVITDETGKHIKMPTWDETPSDIKQAWIVTAEMISKNAVQQTATYYLSKA